MTRGGLRDEPPAGGIDLESELEERTALPLCGYERSQRSEVSVGGEGHGRVRSLRRSVTRSSNRYEPSTHLECQVIRSARSAGGAYISRAQNLDTESQRPLGIGPIACPSRRCRTPVIDRVERAFWRALSGDRVGVDCWKEGFTFGELQAGCIPMD